MSHAIILYSRCGEKRERSRRRKSSPAPSMSSRVAPTTELSAAPCDRACPRQYSGLPRHAVPGLARAHPTCRWPGAPGVRGLRVVCLTGCIIIDLLHVVVHQPVPAEQSTPSVFLAGRGLRAARHTPNTAQTQTVTWNGGPILARRCRAYVSVGWRAHDCRQVVHMLYTAHMQVALGERHHNARLAKPAINVLMQVAGNLRPGVEVCDAGVQLKIESSCPRNGGTQPAARDFSALRGGPARTLSASA